MNTEINTPKNELLVRIITGGLLAVICLGALWVDGWRLLAVSAALSAIMVWELFHMAARDRHLYALIVAALTAAAVWFSGRDEMLLALALIASVVVIGWVLAPAAWRAIFPIYVFAIAAAGLSIFLIRDKHGFEMALWLILVVVSSDIAGYFGGKAFGGAKFAPTISPHKTWSGTISGWAAAAVVGLIMAGPMGVSALALAFVSIIFAAIGQIGDLCESMIKRKADTKDSSGILPGHGGVLDRFDGMIAVLVAALFVRGLMIG